MKACDIFDECATQDLDNKTFFFLYILQIHDIRLEADAANCPTTNSSSIADGFTDSDAANEHVKWQWNDAQSTDDADVSTADSHASIYGRAKCLKQEAVLVLQPRVGFRSRDDHRELGIVLSHRLLQMQRLPDVNLRRQHPRH
jgi:hypothetical protein